MAVLVPVRLGRMQAAFVSAFDAILGAAPQVLWAYAEVPRPASTTDLVRLQLLSGPSYVGSFSDDEAFDMLPTSSEIEITGITTGLRYWVNLNGYPYWHDAVLGDDSDDVRDALIAKLNATDAEETATATSGGTGKITLTPDVPGGIQLLEVSPTAQMTITHGGTERIRVITGERQSTINVQCFAHSAQLSDSAHSMATQLIAGLDLASVRAIFDAAGVSIMAVGPTADLTALAGAHFETRAQFSLNILQKSVLTEQISTIETVQFTMNGTAHTYP